MPLPNNNTQSSPLASSPLTTNVSGLAAAGGAAAGVASALGNLVLVTPNTVNVSATTGYQPLPAGVGLDRFQNILSSEITAQPLVFQYEAENTATMDSDITDHYVESNFSVVDQISIKPEIITVSGFIGELSDVIPELAGLQQTITNTLVDISAYSPQLSEAAIQAYNQAVLLYESAQSAAMSAVSAWNSLTAGPGQEIFVNGEQVPLFPVGTTQNKQQTMFQQFYGYWYQRTLFNIQTPWAVFTDMAIKTMRAIQDESTRMITNFEITFKKIRTASTVTASQEQLASGRAATQSADTTNLGTTAGSPAASSFGTNIAATQ